VHTIQQILGNLAEISVFMAEKRKAEAERIRQKYPDRIPVNAVHLQL